MYDDPLRNLGWFREELTAGLQSSLRIEKVLWASGDLAGFVTPGCVVAARQSDRSNPNHKSLEANFSLLKKFKDTRG